MNMMLKMIIGTLVVISLSMSGCIDQITVAGDGTVTIDPAESATGTVNVQTSDDDGTDTENVTPVEPVEEPAVTAPVEVVDEPVITEPVEDETVEETETEPVEEVVDNDTEVIEEIQNSTVNDEVIEEATENIVTPLEEAVVEEEPVAEPVIDSDGDVVAEVPVVNPAEETVTV